MNWLLTIATLLAFIIVGFMLLVFMPKPQVFFDPYLLEINNITAIHDDIAAEIKTVNDMSPVIPIFGNGEIYDRRFPQIYEALRTIPFVRYAGIINVKPKFDQKKQYGYARNANNTIRHFYTITQSAAHKSGIWVDGAKKFFCEKEWILADMSRENSLFNKNKTDYSIVIFIDIDRININPGNSPNVDVDQDEVLKMFLLAGQ